MRLIAAALLAAAAFAQEDPVIRLKVKEVLVPVTVLDKRGHHVEGLTAADFTLFDEGAPQVVTLSEVRPAGAAKTGSAVRQADARSASTAVARGAEPRTYVICFDGLHTSPEGYRRSQVALDQFLRSRMEGAARIAVVNLNTRIEVLQTATSDVDAVRRMLASTRFAAASSSPQRADLAAAVSDLKEQMERYCGACPCGHTTGFPGSCKQAQEQIRQGMDATAEHFAAIGKAFLTGLKVLVEEEAKLGGLTSLVLVSDGFTLQPGKELYSVASGYAPGTAVFAFASPYDLQPLLEAVTQSAMRADIAIETIDSRGVSNPSFVSGGLHDASTAQMGRSAAANRGGTLYADVESKSRSLAFDYGSGLKQMADATGGEFHHNSNDLRGAFADAFLDGSSYYVLAFAPVNRVSDGRFHSLRVEVAGRKGITLLVKKGYWAEKE